MLAYKDGARVRLISRNAVFDEQLARATSSQAIQATAWQVVRR